MSKNEILKRISIITNEIYQKDFLKVVVGNSFAKAAITGTFRRASHHSITKKVSAIEIVHGTQILQSSHQTCSIKKVVLKNFAIFTGITPVLVFLINKVAGLKACNGIKKDSSIGVFRGILRNF